MGQEVAMTDDAKTRLAGLTREEAKRAGGIDTELGRALDELADKFETLVNGQSDADRLLDEAKFSHATRTRIQDVRQQLERRGLSQSEIEENLRRHAILWVRQRLVLDENRAAYDKSIMKIRFDFHGAWQL